MTNNYSQKEHSHFYIARLVVETKTPLSIAAGEQSATHDNLLVRDANELPAIPGTSFAGVLRHLYQSVHDKQKASELFGTDADEMPEAKEHQPSKVHVSWGCIHNADDKPVQGLLDPEDKSWQQDDVLKDALEDIPVKRDHVKINTRGVADTKNMGKYDRVSLTAGHRFSLELSLWSNTEDDKQWQKLLALLHSPYFRLGGRTRSGLGKLEIVRCHSRYFKLKKKEEKQDDYEDFCELGQDLSDTSKLNLYQFNEAKEVKASKNIALTLESEPEGFRIGAGSSPIDEDSDADLITLVEKRINWTNNKGSVGKPEVLIPASSIKGVLRHRTAYYYHLLNREAERDQNSIDKNKAVTELFGFIPEPEETQQDSSAKAQAGKVLIDDIYIPLNKVTATTLAHNSIDRFTGGVRDHMLYFEEVVNIQESISLNLTLLDIDTLSEQKDEDENQEALKILNAFKYAIYDLINGRLAIGAGSGRSGTGYFTGTCQWIEDIAREIKGEAA